MLFTPSPDSSLGTTVIMHMPKEPSAPNTLPLFFWWEEMVSHIESLQTPPIQLPETRILGAEMGDEVMKANGWSSHMNRVES